MAERVLRGVAASPGVVDGTARNLDTETELDLRVLEPGQRQAALVIALEGVRAAAAELDDLAGRARGDGRFEEAAILEASVLIAGDPTLHATIEECVLRDGCTAGTAIAFAFQTAAVRLASLDDAMLAERGDDVRSLGRRASRLARGVVPNEAQPRGDGAIIVATDLGPADVAELGDDVRGVVLRAGGVTAHAAIVARSLGMPMVVGVEHSGELADGAPIIVDGDAGVVIANPGAERVAAVAAARRGSAAWRERAETDRTPAITRDGHRVRVLANVAGRGDADRALRSGAEGIGLLRTELAFLDAAHWPSADEQRAVLAPIFARAGGETVTVRLFDFGGDKTPPFLCGSPHRGVELLLREPRALRTQLRTIVESGSECRLRLLIPMVESVEQVLSVRRVLAEVVADMRVADAPALGVMVETPAAVEHADELAAECAVLSIGTNDLASLHLGVDRSDAQAARTHHPEVLQMIARVVDAARRAGVVSEVCGEAASEATVMPLLVGLGVDELSVGAARVDVVRSWVRQLSFADAADVAKRALAAGSTDDVERLTAPMRRALDTALR